MAVIPQPEQLESMIRVEDAMRVPIFLVRVDGLIYSTG